MSSPLDALMSVTLPAAAKTVSAAMTTKAPTLADLLDHIVRQTVHSVASQPMQSSPLPDPIHVPHGSYIYPADVVAAKGLGSTEAGAQALSPLGGQLVQGPGDGRSDDVPALGPDGPIALSNGEVHVPPSGVALAGGPQVLDRDVQNTRNNFARHLDVLPPPIA